MNMVNYFMDDVKEELIKMLNSGLESEQTAWMIIGII